MISFSCFYESVVTLLYAFSDKKRVGGGDEFSLQFIIFLLHGLVGVFQ